MIKSKNRKLLFGVILVLITALSFSKVLDDYTDTYTSDAIVNAAITYATARGINAAVSIMQTTTVGFSLGVSGSITVGQILDPINDLIERFSSVMTVVLASLAGQKILLYVSSHLIFQILVALFGGLTILSIYGVRFLPAGPLFKLFLVMVFMRFSLGFVVALNSGVDNIFLMEKSSQYESAILTINQNLTSLSSEEEAAMQEIERIKNEIKVATREFDAISKTLPELKIHKSKALSAFNEARIALDKEKERIGWLGKWDDNPVLDALKKEFDAAKETLDNSNETLAQKKENLAEIKELRRDLNNQLLGKPTGLFDRLASAGTAIQNAANIEKIKQQVSDSIDSFINLMVLYLMKSIIFPLLFFYAFIVVIKKIWSMEYRYINW